jgi:hypothetical protein
VPRLERQDRRTSHDVTGRLVDVEAADSGEVSNGPHMANAGVSHVHNQRFAQTVGLKIVNRPIKGCGKNPRVVLWKDIHRIEQPCFLRSLSLVFRHPPEFTC